MVSKLETMCSMRKAPMGTMPVSEWSLRQKKEWPSPARRGWTPRMGGVAGGAGEAAVAMRTPSIHDACTGGKEKVQHQDYFAGFGAASRKVEWFVRLS